MDLGVSSDRVLLQVCTPRGLSDDVTSNVTIVLSNATTADGG